MRPATTATQLPQLVPERNQLPQVIHTMMDTYRLAGVNWLQVIRCGALPTAAVAGLQWMYFSWPGLASLLANLFGGLLATVIYAIGFHRVLLVSPALIRSTPLHMRAVRGFMLGLVAFIPVLLTVAGLWLLHLLIADALRQPTWLRALMPVGGMVTVLFASFSMVRFSFILPAIALDRSADLPSAMFYSKSQFWRLWSGLMLTLSPVLLIGVVLQMLGTVPGWVVALRSWGVWLAAIALGLIYLTLHYLDYVAPDLAFNRDPRYKVMQEGRHPLVKAMHRYLRFALAIWQLVMLFWQPAAATPARPMYRRRRAVRRLAAPHRKLAAPANQNTTSDHNHAA